MNKFSIFPAERDPASQDNFQFSIKKGFTLIELLVVILVIFSVGVLISSVLFSALRGANKTNTIDTVRRNGNSAITQMSRMIRYSQSFNGVSTDGVSYTTCDGRPIVSVPLAISSPPPRLGFFPELANLIQRFGNLGKKEVSSLFSKLAIIPQKVFAAPAYTSAVLADTPVSYWRLGELSGTTAFDELNSNPGTITGDVRLGITGALISDANKAMTFNGINGSINVPDALNLRITGNLTIEAWVKPLNRSNFYFIVTKDDLNYPYPYEYRLEISNGIPNLLLGGTSAISFLGTSAPPTDVWSYIVVTVSGSTVTHYLNGSLNGSRTQVVSNTDAAKPLRIASRDDNYSFFNGSLDEIAIYNKALTAAQISNHYQLAITPPPPTPTPPPPTPTPPPPTPTPTPGPTPTPTQYHYLKITGFDGGITTFICNGSTIASASATTSVSLIDTSSVDASICYFTCSQNNIFSPPNIGINFSLTQKGNPQFFENKAKADFQTSVSVRNY